MHQKMRQIATEMRQQAAERIINQLIALYNQPEPTAKT